MVEPNDIIDRTKADFAIQQVIAKSVISTVHKGKNKATQEPVAIKIINRFDQSAGLMKTKMSEGDSINLENEIGVLKACSHPNICKLISVYDDPSYYSLVMELM